jgi:hypothetical protein
LSFWLCFWLVCFWLFSLSFFPPLSPIIFLLSCCEKIEIYTSKPDKCYDRWQVYWLWREEFFQATPNSSKTISVPFTLTYFTVYLQGVKSLLGSCRSESWNNPIFPNNFLPPNSHTKDEVVYHSSEDNIYTKTLIIVIILNIFPLNHNRWSGNQIGDVYLYVAQSKVIAGIFTLVPTCITSGANELVATAPLYFSTSWFGVTDGCFA